MTPQAPRADRSLVIDLMHFDDRAGRILEEDLVPALHCPCPVVGVGDLLLLEAALERFDVVGPEAEMAAVERARGMRRARSRRWEKGFVM